MPVATNYEFKGRVGQEEIQNRTHLIDLSLQQRSFRTSFVLFLLLQQDLLNKRKKKSMITEYISRFKIIIWQNNYSLYKNLNPRPQIKYSTDTHYS